MKQTREDGSAACDTPITPNATSVWAEISEKKDYGSSPR